MARRYIRCSLSRWPRCSASLCMSLAATLWAVAAAQQPSTASAIRSVTLDQEPKPLLVGERVNSQGSRKVKQLLLDDNYDAIIDVARSQVDGGAHVLDVQV